MKKKPRIQKTLIFTSLFLIIFGMSSFIHPGSALWSRAEVITTTSESSEDARLPRIAIDGQGNLHVVWMDNTSYSGAGSDHDLFYKCWNSTNENWSSSELITPGSNEHSFMPQMSLDPLGNIHVVWQEKTTTNDNDIYYSVRNASTQIWTAPTIVSTNSWDHCYRSYVLADDSGNVHVTWTDDSNLNSSGGDSDIYYKRKNGTTGLWEPQELVSSGSWNSSWRNTMAIENDILHIMWADTSYGWLGSGNFWDIFYRKFNLTSGTWSSVELISVGSTQDSQLPSLLIDSSGNKHVTWFDVIGGKDAPKSIFYRFWNASEGSWNTPANLSFGSGKRHWFPKIALDGNDNLHMVYMDDSNYNGAGDDFDIVYRRKMNGTMDWTTPEVVSLQSTDEAAHPSLAIEGPDGNGYVKIHVVWDDWTDYDFSGFGRNIAYSTLETNMEEQQSENWWDELFGEENNGLIAYIFVFAAFVSGIILFILIYVKKNGPVKKR
ncbi:MAG: hypothetical protein ACFFCS_04455 [Candidatus Hodarchaeota archaeon]